MQPSSILCRAQEAHHLALATAATLENAKAVATAAAAAWGKEAAAAEKREERKLHQREQAEYTRLHRDRPGIDDLALSENPDRGLASDVVPDRRNLDVALTRAARGEWPWSRD